MDKNTLFIIIIFFLISNRLFKVLWDVIRGVLYLLILLIGLKSLNKDLFIQVKCIVKKLLSLDLNLMMDILSNGSKKILNMVGSNNNNTTKKNQNKIY